MNVVRSIIRPPSFEEEGKTRAAALLHFILISTFIINFLAILGDAFLSRYGLVALEDNIITGLVQIGLFVLMRRGQVRLAGLIFTAFGWFVVAFAAYSNTGILNPIFAAETLIIMIAGLLISEWASVGFAAMSIVFGLWLVQAAEAGNYPASIGEIAALHAWVNYVTIFILAALLLFISRRAIREARGRAALAHDALQASEEQYRQLFDANPHPMYVLEVETGRFLAVNDMMVEKYGYSHDEFLQMKIMDVILSKDVAAAQMNAVAFRQQKLGYSKSGPWGHRRKDESVIIVEIEIHRLNYDGKKAVMCATFDLTERIRAEEALRDSEKLFSEIFESVPVAIAIVTLAEGLVVNVNNYLLELTGYKRDELIGTIAADSPIWVNQSEVVKVVQTIQKDSTFHGIEFDWRTRSGQILNIFGSAMQIEVNGQPCILAIGLDITGRKEAEQARREAERLVLELEKEREVLLLKDRFISTMSHEFRTPLTIVLTAKESLQHYYDRLSIERRQEHFSNIDDQIRFLVNLLDEILTLSKARAGKMEFNPAPLDLVGFCQKVFEQIQMTDTADHQFVFASEQEQYEINADRVLLQRMLVNLLSNAVKYSPQGGEIRVALSRATDSVTIQVSDQGIGIPLEDQAHLFEPFFRANNAKSSPGTGLGLAIVKECVETHGGSIACESEEGKGTTFVVRLPLHAPPTSDSALEVSP